MKTDANKKAVGALAEFAESSGLMPPANQYPMPVVTEEIKALLIRQLDATVRFMDKDKIQGMDYGEHDASLAYRIALASLNAESVGEPDADGRQLYSAPKCFSAAELVDMAIAFQQVVFDRALVSRDAAHREELAALHRELERSNHGHLFRAHREGVYCVKQESPRKYSYQWANYVTGKCGRGETSEAYGFRAFSICKENLTPAETVRHSDETF